MSTFRLFLITACSVLALALFLLAGDQLLTFLNVDLVATMLRANPLARPLEPNEAAAIAEARYFGAAGALALGFAIVLGFYHLLQRGDPLRDSQQRLAQTLHEQEMVLVSHYRDLGAQLARSRDTLASDMGDMGASTQHMRGALELRFASVESSLKRMDETLTSRLEGLAAQVSHTLQSSDSKSMSDQAQASQLINERLHAIDQQLEQRFEGLAHQVRGGNDGLDARIDELGRAFHGSRSEASNDELDQQMLAVQARLDLLDERLDSIGAQWRGGTEQLGLQLSGIDMRLADTQADGVSDAAFFEQANLLRANFEQLTRRVESLEVWLRSSGERVGSQLTDLSQRMAQVQSVNNSNFGDFNTQPAQLTGTHGGNGAAGNLQTVLLNLAHLQVDLRAERSALRKRLRELPKSSQG
jgi:hypothetical protein